ncbi:hypothetical protein MRB53_005884 [Persea americana]|uniref:Uncharacterized protein n=1 Tax=Persea americana TaxID=3435 RepID=A0ACC2MFF9_PERAE|nr:hypothetical protein MRB53_005884 [Persea americana]
MWENGVITFDKNYGTASVNMVSYGQTSKSSKEKVTTSFKVIKMTQTSQELVPYPTPEGQPIWVHPDLLEDENWEIVKTKSTAQQRRQAKRQLRKLKQQEKAQTKQEVPEKAETSSTASLGATEGSLSKVPRVIRKFTLSDFMPPRLRDETTQGTSYSCNSVVGFSMNGYESSDTASDTDEWEESLETGEYLSDEEWISESHLMTVIWYNPFQPQGSWSDDDEDQEAAQIAINTAQTNALVDPNQVEPQGADEEKDLAPMPDLEEYARILQHLAIEQEQDRINQLHQNLEPEVPENLRASSPGTLENEASCWIDDPLTSEDESDSQRSIMEASSIEVACNVIVQYDSASEAPFVEATDSQNVSSSISSGATYSRVTSTEITPSQPSSPETVTSEFKPLPTDHHEEALTDEVFKENPVNWSQDLFPENAPCNAITEDDNAAVEVFSANGEDQPLEPEGGLPKEEPPLEAFEVGKAVNAPSGGDNENAGLKEAFKYDLIEHFKHIPVRLQILDLLRMSPQTRDSLISELQRLNLDVKKHAPQVLQIEMDYRVTKSKTSSKGEKKEAGGPCTECLSVQKAASATIAFNKEDLLLGETKHNRPLYFTGYIKEMLIHRVQIDLGSALNLISTSALEELGILPSKLSHTSVSIFGYDGSAQRPIGKIRFRLLIGDLISEVTVYAIKTPSCYNILLGRPWIHENGVVPSTLHQCIKFVGDDGLIHRVFADKKPFKGKEVHFADSQMYKDEKEGKEEKTTSFAGNLQKDKGKAPQRSSEENKPSSKLKESNQSPFVFSLKSPKPLVITTKAKKTERKTGGKFVVSFVSIIQDTDSDSETEDDTSSSQADTQQVRPVLTPLETPADVEDPASATFVIPETSAEDKPIFFHRSDASSSNCLLEPF